MYCVPSLAHLYLVSICRGLLSQAYPEYVDGSTDWLQAQERTIIPTRTFIGAFAELRAHIGLSVDRLNPAWEFLVGRYQGGRERREDALQFGDFPFSSNAAGLVNYIQARH
ncbi:unnamed protein product [Victoria cruziana]